jgi:hypothetical protein
MVAGCRMWRMHGCATVNATDKRAATKIRRIGQDACGDNVNARLRAFSFVTQARTIKTSTSHSTSFVLLPTAVDHIRARRDHNASPPRCILLLVPPPAPTSPTSPMSAFRATALRSLSGRSSIATPALRAPTRADQSTSSARLRRWRPSRRTSTSSSRSRLLFR